MSSKSLVELILGGLVDAQGPAMQSNALALLSLSGLKAEDMVIPGDSRHQTVFAIIDSLARRRKHIDATTVWTIGHASKSFTEDDRRWLRDLQVSNELDTERFTQVVEDFRAVRRHGSLVNTLDQYLQQLREKKIDVMSCAAALEAHLRDLTATSAVDGTGEDDVYEVSSDWELQEQGKLASVTPTGITEIDRMIKGWRPNLNIIAGQPSSGKSALLASIIDAQLDMGLDADGNGGMVIGLFGLEDATRWIFERLIARDLKIPLSEVGVRHRPPEMAERYQNLAAAHSKRLRRLITYRHDSIITDDLCRRGASWVYSKKCASIYVDNGSEVEHLTDTNQDHRLRVGESYRRMRNTAISTNCPWVVLVHTARPEDQAERPPRLTEIAESAYIERRARVVLGMWEKDKDADYSRCTVLKNTKGKRGLTSKLLRHTEAALIDRVEGESVSLEAEKWQEINAAKERKLENQAKEKALKEAMTAKLKAEREAGKARQKAFGE